MIQIKKSIIIFTISCIILLVPFLGIISVSLNSDMPTVFSYKSIEDDNQSNEKNSFFSSKNDFREQSLRQWTIMIYMAADNDLEAYVESDINEIRNRVLGIDSLAIIVQVDGWDSCGSEKDIPYFNGTERFLIEGDEQIALTVEKEVNMGDGDSLREFVYFSMMNYPARFYCLIFWNHGLAWQTGSEYYSSDSITRNNLGRVFDFQEIIDRQNRKLCVDDRSFGDSLTEEEIVRALTRLPTKIDVIAFDACLMGCVETAFALRDLANYMVASEDSIGSAGFFYDGFLDELESLMLNNETVEPRSLAIMIAEQSFGRQFSYPEEDGTFYQLSVIDLNMIVNLTLHIDRLGLEIQKLNTDQMSIFCQNLGDIAFFDLYEQIDLGSLALKLKALNKGLNSLISDFLETLDNTVIWNQYHEKFIPVSYGLSIYVPWANNLWIDNYYELTYFAKETRWYDTIKAIYKGSIISNNSYIISEKNTKVSGEISEGSLAFYYLRLHWGQYVDLILYGEPYDSDFNLYLFNSEGLIVDYSEKEYFPKKVSYFAENGSETLFIVIYAYLGSGVFDLSADFAFKFEKVDLIGIPGVIIKDYDNNNKIDELSLVLLIDSPKNLDCSFIQWIIDETNSFGLTWNQSLVVGYQLKILKVPLSLIFLAFHDNSIRNERWTTLGSLEIRDKNGTIYFSSIKGLLPYLIKKADVDPKVLIHENIGTFQVVFENFPTLSLYDYNKSVHSTPYLIKSIPLLILIVLVRKQFRRRRN
ncbi:MAG: clostripain-related cysteine peptidase [Candidatus Hodarchaeales archaeon]